MEISIDMGAKYGRQGYGSGRMDILVIAGLCDFFCSNVHAGN